jgi:hypothetical protein
MVTRRSRAADPGRAHNTADDGRRLRLTPASTIRPQPVRWLWEDRIPLGALTLIGGREGIGKSTYAYDLAADITQGKVPGVFKGRPKSVLVCATEDSWEHTIVPRLIAAGADLSRVYRVDVRVDDTVPGSLSLPLDIPRLRQAVRDHDAAVILLDPLMSRLDAALDTHKDAEVRRALEPIGQLADQSRCAVIGLIHVNKSTSTDPLTTLMGSRAFTAVARAVIFIMKDPDSEHHRLLGQPKNNLGRSDLPTLKFVIDNTLATKTDEGELIWCGKLRWDGESDLTISDALEAATTGDDGSAVSDAAAWLVDYLEQQGGGASAKDVKAAARDAGHAERTLHRARKKKKITVESHGYPCTSYWLLPASRAKPCQES